MIHLPGLNPSNSLHECPHHHPPKFSTNFRDAHTICAGSVWFLAVDSSFVLAECPDCLEQHSIQQIRICGQPIREQIHLDPSDIQRASVDLGVPCQHANMQRWHRQRFWGMLVCGYPCINGLTGLAGDPTSYDRLLAAKVKQLRIERPEASAEFRQRVLIEHDYDYWQKFCRKLIDDNEHADANIN